MGWQQINSKIMRTGQDGGDSEVESLGYLKGDGHEEGFYCFNLGPWHPYEPYISAEYSPHLEIDGTSFFLQDFTFNGKKVFATQGTLEQPDQKYVFWANSMGAWVYLPSGGIREPYYWTDIDEETVLGDAFYVGGQALPDLNDTQGPEDWDLAGNNTLGLPSTVDVALKHEYWEWWTNGNGRLMKPCGKYRNPADGSMKFVGAPTWKAANDTGGAYYHNKEFQRAGKDTLDNWIYRSTDGGLTIHFVPAISKWVLGTLYGEAWSEGDVPPMTGMVRYLGYTQDQTTHQPVRDSHGDFDLSWDRMDIGTEKREVLMGEVSLWRRTSSN